MITPEQWDRFFDALSRTGTIKTACAASGIGRRTVYNRIEAAAAMDADPEAKEWLAAFRMAEADAGDVCEEEAHRRAIEGVEEPVFQNGAQVGTIRRYSDGLLMALLKARKPEKFKDRVASEVSGPGGKPIQTEARVIAIPAIPDDAAE